MMCFSCRVTSVCKSSVFGCNTNASGYYIRFSYICLLLTIKFEYMENISRRTAIKTFLAGGVALATTGIEGGSRREKENRREGTLERKCPPLRK